jgi:hypothetical protein
MKSAMSIVTVFAAALAVACGTVASVDNGNGAGGPNGSGAATTDAGPGTFGGDGGRGSAVGDGGFCQGTGGILVPGTDQCTADVGKKTFLFALCSCEGLSMRGTLSTSSFDSTTKKSGGVAASVGTNGAFTSSASMDLGGALWALGRGATGDAMSLEGTGHIASRVQAGGGLAARGSFTVGDDVFVNGGVTGGLVDVAGRVHLPGGSVPTEVSSRGVVKEPVVVAEPCNCNDPVPIAPIVAAFRTANDDVASGISPAELAGFLGKELTLSCGRYYFDGIHGTNLGLHLTGRTAIFVAGDFDVSGASTLTLAPGAEVDLFVTGNLRIAGAQSFGWVDAPAKVRIYAGGADVTLDGAIALAANLYAPAAVVHARASLDVSGALFAGGLDVQGAVTVKYDEAILAVQGCQAPAGSCKTCHDCEGTACNGGTCGACTTDADCCAPTRCADGRCVQTIK